VADGKLSTVATVLSEVPCSGRESILTIGFELASQSVPSADFATKVSLLDCDIVLFKPEINQFLAYRGEPYQGKPCLDDTASFRLKECAAHWLREIHEACQAGKTIVVFLSELVQVFVATGERTYSGTGRSRSATRMVTEYNNSCITTRTGEKPVGAIYRSLSGGVLRRR
jgi:hypothetical protein